jgi:DNA-binding transcriptional ArsR family regulator
MVLSDEDKQVIEARQMSRICEALKRENKPVILYYFAERNKEFLGMSHMVVRERVKKLLDMGIVEKMQEGYNVFVIWHKDIIKTSSHATEQGEVKGEPSSPDGEREELPETNSGPKEGDQSQE